MKKADLKGKNKKELETLLTKVQKELLDLKMENSMQKLKNPHALTQKRKELARINTQIRLEEIPK